MKAHSNDDLCADAIERIMTKYPKRFENISTLVARIRPVVSHLYAYRVETEVFYFVTSTEGPGHVPLETLERAPTLKTLRDITTYHEIYNRNFFCPNIPDVILQIPEEIFDEVVAFEIISWPRTNADLKRHSFATRSGYHVAKTRLYSRF